MAGHEIQDDDIPGFKNDCMNFFWEAIECPQKNNGSEKGLALVALAVMAVARQMYLTRTNGRLKCTLLDLMGD